MPKISVIIPVYNEEHRLGPMLASALAFGDEVIVCNKQSTDATAAVAAAVSPAVLVRGVPFTEKGADCFEDYLRLASHEWVFIAVASEIIPLSLKGRLSEFFAQHDEASLDMVMVPRKFFCFGSHLPQSPWSVSYFPFLFHKRRVRVTNKVYEHFSVSDESRRAFLACADAEMVVHCTHTSADAYCRAMLGYFKEEVRNMAPEQIDATYINKMFDEFLMYERELRNSSDINAIMHYSAWAIYWHGVILFACEKKLNLDVERIYRALGNPRQGASAGPPSWSCDGLISSAPGGAHLARR